MMLKFYSTSFVLLFTHVLFSQTKAITENGEEVILYENGQWAYLSDSILTAPEIPVNSQEFTKSKSSSFLVKSKKCNMGVWINPKEWSFLKGSEHEASEYQFQKKNTDVYALFISEKISIPIESLKEIAIENARSVSYDLKIVNEEYRNVNGIQVLHIEMAGTIKGVKFTYYGYYYSNSEGTLQFLTYTGQNLFKDYKNDMELLLNGLVEVK